MGGGDGGAAKAEDPDTAVSLAVVADAVGPKEDAGMRWGRERQYG